MIRPDAGGQRSTGSITCHLSISLDGFAAGDEDVMIAGGASVVQQYLAAGRLEELYVASPAATHVKYRVVR